MICKCFKLSNSLIFPHRKFLLLLLPQGLFRISKVLKAVLCQNAITSAVACSAWPLISCLITHPEAWHHASMANRLSYVLTA